ncbi:MAG: TIGR03435 family protein [Acidobacteriaceae bacterium]
MAVGQTATAPIATTTTTVPAKAYAFEVVSIRQNLYAATQHMGQPQFGPTPDGFSMTGMPLILPILTAYVPQVGGAAFYENDQIKGIPDWLNTERYDIDARISDEGRAEWQKPESQKVMLRAMLQAMLVERCKIVVHRESKNSSVYLLEVGKSGPKFKETNPTAGHPPGRTLPGGATLVPGDNGAMRLYGVSMGMLATVLSSLGVGDLGRPIQDKTGLAGLYDVEIPRQDMGTADGQSLDPSEKVFATVEALGLKLESSKSSVETLVIDHIEKPSAN